MTNFDRTLKGRITQLLLVCVLGFWTIEGNSQGWEQIYHQDNNGKTAFDKTPDDGYIMLNRKLGAPFLDPDTIRIVKTDASGNVQWVSLFEDSTHLYGADDIKTTPDSGYIALMSGPRPSNGNGNASYVYKLDQVGNIQWSQITELADPVSVTLTSNGGNLSVGRVALPGSVNYPRDMYVSKLNSLGAVEWQHPVMKQFYNEDAAEVIETADSGFIICGGGVDSMNPNVKFGFLVKLNDLGQVEWSKSYGTSGTTEFESVQQTADGGYIVSGMRSAFTGWQGFLDSDMLALKTDDLGVVEWQNTYGGLDEDFAIDIVETPNGNYMICGTTHSFDPTPGYYQFPGVQDSLFLITTLIDPFGAEIRSNVYGPHAQSWGVGVQNIDDGFIFFGSVSEPNHWAPLGSYLIETDSLGVMCANDCVWPGDADDNGIANVLDVLAIGLSYNNTGLLRYDNSLDWYAHPSFDWNSVLYNGADEKHADCNGDATIDLFDLLAILVNYNSIHSKTEERDTFDAAPLFVVFPDDTVSGGDTVTGIIHLGMDTLPVDSFYGISFALNYDNSVIDTGTMDINFTTSWAGMDTNTISLTYDLPLPERPVSE